MITTQVSVESAGHDDEYGHHDVNKYGQIVQGHKTKRFYRVDKDRKKARTWKRYTPHFDSQAEEVNLTYQQKKCIEQASIALKKYKQDCHGKIQSKEDINKCLSDGQKMADKYTTECKSTVFYHFDKLTKDTDAWIAYQKEVKKKEIEEHKKIKRCTREAIYFLQQ